jgi:hypothetical protein
MRLFKIILLTWTFYKRFLFVSLLITTSCLILFWEYGFSIFRELFWFKIASLALIFYFINSYRANEYYYYRNLGVSKIMLWSVTLVFDFALFIFLIIELNTFK